MDRDPPQERTWTVNGLTLCGLCWGSPEQPPLLMLHGWLDNAASFRLLAPLLTDYYVVAPDLTGHGRSDRRSPDAGYQIWDDLPEILGIVEQLGWSKFDLLGHSRGAIIGTLLASAFPERIKHLILLDAITPEAVPEDQFPNQLRAHLEQKPALSGAGNRQFPTALAAARERQKRGLNAQAAMLLVERSIKPSDDGVTWTTDRRLHGASAVKLSAGQIRYALESLTMPVLLLLAEGGRVASASASLEILGYCTALVVEYRVGGHHFHMEEPVSPLATRINGFLQRESVAFESN